MLGVEANTSIGAHAYGETLVEPTIVPVAVEQFLAKVIQQFWASQVELEGLVVQGEHEGGRLNGAQRHMIGASREEGVPGLRPFGAVPGGQGSQMLLTRQWGGLCLQNLLNLTVKKWFLIRYSSLS